MNARVGTKRTKIKKGDQVVVIAGRDNSKRGRVLEVSPTKGKVKVEGVAVHKRHERANSQLNRGGGIIDRESWIDISNVQLIDPQTGRPTRARYETNADSSKSRVAKSGQVIERK